MSLKFTVGDLTIHRIVEQEGAFYPATCFLNSRPICSPKTGTGYAKQAR
jgi:hypothetical protein